MKEFGNQMSAWIVGTGITIFLGVARILQMFAKHTNKDALQQRDIDQSKKSIEKLDERTFVFNKDMGSVITENKYLKENNQKLVEENQSQNIEIAKLKDQWNEFDKRLIKLEK
ncbi:hypothetical protein [uncultured Microscilla sp.]|uniref:hypothetical protein n=1 Tax=uncultured Microscilla sp. TaxID=432653 RepID=UPI002623565F|nr:hypothetical protein [uncultured Microscilla sp.]